ncbi:uncharacterized protein [Parasteatoda tepidariorum]|nr:zinc finger protein 569 [Parasteatoda tepidariorum]XP_015910621.2 zinc finger protein 569 [Parasteatoda tepidariorum]
MVKVLKIPINMENMETDISLPQSVEFVDAMCLEKSIILSDGCTTATITTVDGQALPVTFIVSQPLQDSPNDTQSVQDLINTSGVSIVCEQNDDLKLNNAKDDPSSVYAVHFPTDDKSVDQSFLRAQENSILCENKSGVMVDNSFTSDLLTNQESDADLLTPIPRLEDFMDVVTTYKCKFCRFSCPWKAGLMSHIRCCHINEKQNIVTVKAEKNPNVEENSLNLATSSNCAYNPVEKTSELVQSKPCIASQDQSFNMQAENCNFTEKVNQCNQDFVEISSCALPQSENPSVELDVRKIGSPETSNSLTDKFKKDCSDKEDSNPFFENSEIDTDNENSSSLDSPVERHIFLCGQCSEGFASLDECKQHMVEDHDLKLEQNDIKPLKKRGRPRKQHLPKETNDPPPPALANENAPKERKRQSRPPRILVKDFECGIKKKAKKDTLKTYRCTRTGCACKFSSEAFLLYHYASHSDIDKTFVCQVCNEGFELWRILVMHLWKEHSIDIDLFSCSDCSYKTFSLFKLNNHRKIHSDERSYVCETCGKGFKQISQLRNHVVIHLDRKSITEKRWYSEQLCDICGRKFSDAKCLRKHKQAVHKKLKPYVCTFCGHLSARKAMLQLHMRQHTGEKPFVCEHCDYRTGDHNSLRRHRMRHTGAKPYKCPHCPYACIQAISYKTHLRNKHPGMEGLYSCTFCSFKSVSKENFLHHVSDHERQGSNIELEAASASASIPEGPLETAVTDPSSVEMQLTDNAVQQLEGILPSNVTAAQLIYSCLNALNQDGGTVNLPPGITVNIPQGDSNVDGTQTITIQLPSGQDLENEPYYFTIQQQDGTTTSLVLPNDEQNDENAQAATDLAGVQFAGDNLTDTSELNCDAILQSDHNAVHGTDQDEASVSMTISNVLNGSTKISQVLSNVDSSCI